MPEQVARNFDLFRWAPGAKPGGIGLGLAIDTFVEAQGGRMAAANRFGGGVFSYLYAAS
jgi:K+-sensing histidine kinase KdpD